MHSVLTTLPAIMLLAGIGYYFFAENRQQSGALIMAQSVETQGLYRGISAQSKRKNAQRILWLQTAAGSRGYRITAEQARVADVLNADDPISLAAAPRVADSKVLWIYRLARGQQQLLSLSPADDAVAGE